MNRLRVTGLAAGVVLLSATAFAEPAKDVDELLQRVRAVANEQSALDKKRMAEFRSARDEQKNLLKKAEARLRELEKRSRDLEKEFAFNEKKVAELQEDLRIKQGTRGEMFGVARQVAGDTQAQLRESLISAQHPDRAKELSAFATAKDVPSIDQLQKLWLLMQEEMTWSREVTQFEAPVVVADGQTETKKVVRVGTFVAAADGRFLTWNPGDAVLVELGRQPPGSYTNAIADLRSGGEGFMSIPVDPSRGTILSLLVETPSFAERISFGGAIGYIVLGLGAAAFLFGILKLLLLMVAKAKVSSQLKNKTPSPKNPLGRVLGLARGSGEMDVEAFEARLEEGVLRESSRLESGIWVVKVVQVAAPLLGLLGTVTGMINTFQAITLFGTGDPRLMAGGISEALVTTMLGLMVAIPLVLLTSLLNNLSKGITDVLDEQAAGLVAERIESEEKAGAQGMA